MRILVTDGNSRASLAITRSLGRKGHEVHVACDTEASLAGSSKYCALRHTYPDPAVDRNGFLDAIEALVTDNAFDILVPATDVSVLPIARHRERIERHCLVPLPSSDTIELAADKARISKLAAEIGVATPRTLQVEADETATVDFPTYPVVIKPSRSRVRTDSGWLFTGVDYAADHSELSRKLAALPQAAFPVLLQERIPGPGVGVFYCFDRGRRIATFAHRRLHEKPPSGGVSVLRESVAPHELANSFGIKLLESIGWHGVAMVEFKLDERDGIPKLMEINGRFWGSLQLAIDAGVDFPDLLVRIASGESVETVPDYKLGVRSRWLWGEVDLLLLFLLKSRDELQLPEGHDSRLVSALKTINPFIRGQKLEVLRLTDIRPWLHESRCWFSGQ